MSKASKIISYTLCGIGLATAGILTYFYLSKTTSTSQNDSPSSTNKYTNFTPTTQEEKEIIKTLYNNTAAISILDRNTMTVSMGTIWNYPMPLVNANSSRYYFATNIHVVDNAILRNPNNVSQPSIASFYEWSCNIDNSFKPTESYFAKTLKNIKVEHYSTALTGASSSSEAFQDFAILSTTTQIWKNRSLFNQDDFINASNKIKHYDNFHFTSSENGQETKKPLPIYTLGYPVLTNNSPWNHATPIANKYEKEWTCASTFAGSTLNIYPSQYHWEATQYEQQIIMPDLDIPAGSSGSLMVTIDPTTKQIVPLGIWHSVTTASSFFGDKQYGLAATFISNPKNFTIPNLTNGKGTLYNKGYNNII